MSSDPLHETQFLRKYFLVLILRKEIKAIVTFFLADSMNVVQSRSILYVTGTVLHTDI